MGRPAGNPTAVGKSSTARLFTAVFLRLDIRRAVLAALSLLLFAGMPLPALAQEGDPARITPNKEPAQPFVAGVDAFDRGEFAKAHEIWLAWAHRGDPAAQRNLAHLYRMGLGVPQDFVQAVTWYRLAADNGLARAQANLASMYLRGQGVAEDPQQAAYWFTAAAVNGHVLAQYNLALLYLRGEGVTRNEAKAAGWLYKAAKAGHKQAIRTLGDLVGIISGPAGPPGPSNQPNEPVRPAIQPKQLKSADASSKPVPDEPETAKAPKLAALVPPEMDPAKTEPVKAEPRGRPGELAQPEEDGSLLDVLTAFFSINSAPENRDNSDNPDDLGDLGDLSVPDGPAVMPESGREETARRNIAAGLVALHTANFSAAKARWQPLAEDGHAEAQYQLGKLYLTNGFSEASRPRGFFWLSRAALQKHAGAVASKKTLDSVMSREERLAARQLVHDVAGGKAGWP
jgi:TPR repeat protein